MNTNKRLQSVIDFLNFHTKEGIYDQEFFDGMTDEEILEFVDYEAIRTDIAIEDYKETYYGETSTKGGE